MSDMEKHISEYFRYFSETLNFWKSVIGTTSTLLRPLCNQSEQLRICARAQLDEKFLQRFPCVKEKLLGKVQVGIEEEMRSILKVEEEMKVRVDGLKMCLTSVEKAYSKFRCDESLDFNPLIPSIEVLVEHALDTWKIFHILWMGVKTSIETVDYLSQSSINKISESLLKFKTLEPHLKYIADLTQFLRT